LRVLGCRAGSARVADSLCYPQQAGLAAEVTRESRRWADQRNQGGSFGYGCRFTGYVAWQVLLRENHFDCLLVRVAICNSC
jgi:hypothetical protein